MVRLHFDTADEFEGLFKQKSRKVTDAMVLGIEKAMLENKKSADIFQITFGEEEVAFDISIVRSEWKHALQSCLDHLHHENLTDEQIDCWKLLELVKNMQE